MLKSSFERFGGFQISKGSEINILNVLNLFERFDSVYNLKIFDLSSLSGNKIICRIWRCLDFKKLGDNGNAKFDNRIRDI